MKSSKRFLDFIGFGFLYVEPYFYFKGKSLIRQLQVCGRFDSLMANIRVAVMNVVIYCLVVKALPYLLSKMVLSCS